MNALITGLFGVIIQEAGDAFRVSKTKMFANLGAGGGIYAWIPGAMEGDAEAIGMLVLALVAYVGTLMGRGNKG